MKWTFGNFSVEWDDDGQTGEPTNIRLGGFNGVISVVAHDDGDNKAWSVLIRKINNNNVPVSISFDFNEAERAKEILADEGDDDYLAMMTLYKMDEDDPHEYTAEEAAEEVNDIIAFIADNF
jgi:hypothetical protein